MYKAASGAIEKIIFLEVSNIVNEIKLLKSKNFWVLGMDGNSKEILQNYNKALKNIVVFGSENEGMRNIVKANCDSVCKIPINKRIDSLNVSNAASITLAFLNFVNK